MERLDKYYGDSAPSISMVKKWFTEFRCGRTNTNDAERPGRPKDAFFPKTKEKTLFFRKQIFYSKSH